MLDALQGPAAHAFALYTGIAGAAAAIGLARGAGRERAPAVLMPVGIVSLACAFATGAPVRMPMLAGALLLAGLILGALAPSRSAGPAVAALLGWSGIALALIGAFIGAQLTPNLPT